MKLRSVSLLLFYFSLAFACNAQNGPTAPSVTLSWTQSIGNTNPITKNCVYRCTGVSSCTYDKPALFCSTAPVTTYKDLQVTRGTTYHYAVTASDTNGAESAYSTDLPVLSPIINAPTGLAAILVTKLERALPFLFPEPKPASITATNRDHTLTAVAE